MRVPISGIVVGFRVIKSQGKEASDVAKLFVCQPGDKDHDAFLVTIFVQQVELLHDLLTTYSSGSLRWINTYCCEVISGREKVWLLEQIFSFPQESIEIETVMH